MAKINNTKDLYVDRHLMKVREWEINGYRDTYDYESWFSPYGQVVPGKMHMKAKIYLLDGTEVRFEPKAHEQKEDSIHLYGLLESLFPVIAGDYYMEDWKAAYLHYVASKKQLASQSIHRYTIDKDDFRFNNKEAKAFKAGYDVRGKK